MAKVEMNGILIGEVETKNIMTKSSLPVGGYSVNPYVGCTHACKYCYASFMKRFTGHMEEWGTFLDVKHWPKIKNPKKFAGQRIVIGSVTATIRRRNSSAIPENCWNSFEAVAQIF